MEVGQTKTASATLSFQRLWCKRQNHIKALWRSVKRGNVPRRGTVRCDTICRRSSYLSDRRKLSHLVTRRKCLRFRPISFAMLVFASLTGLASGRYFAAKVSAQQPPAMTGGTVRALLPDEVVKGRLDGRTQHTYQIKLTTGESVRIAVEQQGVDIGIRILAPDNSTYINMDSPNGYYGFEIASIVARVSGTYTIVVYPEAMPPTGDYILKVDGPRGESPIDETRVTLERAFVDAQALRLEARRVAPQLAGEKYALSLSKYDEALKLATKIDDSRWQGYALCGTGRVYKAQMQLVPALDHLSQALTRLQEAGDISGQAFVLNETGAAHRDLGSQLDAAASFEQALPLRVSIGDRWGQAQLYNNIGLAYSNIGYQPKALENYEKALSLWRELGVRRLEMNTINNIAKAHAEMGELDKALAEYESLLAYCNTEISNADDEYFRLKPEALNGIGLVYDTWADADKARSSYQEALKFFEETGKESATEASVLDNLGLTEAFLGDAQSAFANFSKALTIRQRFTDPRGLGITLSNLGYSYVLQGNVPEALKQLELALTFSQRAHDQRFEAYTLMRMGMAYAASGEPDRAMNSYAKALAIQREPSFADSRGQAITLEQMAEVLTGKGDLTEGLKRHNEALALWEQVKDEQGRALSLFGIARIEYRRHNLANARDRIEQAIAIVEKVRYRVTVRQLQLTYFAGKQDMYALATDVRMQLYELTHSKTDLEAALSISEKARARNLLDLLSETRAKPHVGMSPENVEKYFRLERQISELTQTMLRLRGLGAKEEAATVERKILTSIDEQNDLMVTAKEVAPSSTAVNHVEPLSATQIQGLLDDKTLLLQYSLGENHSHLWVVSQTEVSHYFLAGRSEIENAARQLHQALTTGEPRRPGEEIETYLNRLRHPVDYEETARELRRLVIDPSALQLRDKRLVVVADGALQSIPFEVLLFGKSTARRQTDASSDTTGSIGSNEIVYLPSVSTLASMRLRYEPVFSKTLAVLADPVFTASDMRVRGSRQTVSAKPETTNNNLAQTLRDLGDAAEGPFTLPKLDYSLKEANAIVSLAPKGSWMRAVGFNATRAMAMSPSLKQYRFIHFATHGFLNDRHPELSGMALSMVNKRGGQEDGYLTLHDIYNLDLPVDLVVLSACLSGVGKNVRGEGVIGLTRGFMHAGAQRVVVSLWLVEDRATAELMTRFYSHMLGRNRLAPAAALQRAKMEIAANPRWRNPYYWSGFVLQGDWK